MRQKLRLTCTRHFADFCQAGGHSARISAQAVTNLASASLKTPLPAARKRCRAVLHESDFRWRLRASCAARCLRASQHRPMDVHGRHVRAGSRTCCPAHPRRPRPLKTYFFRTYLYNTIIIYIYLYSIHTYIYICFPRRTPITKRAAAAHGPNGVELSGDFGYPLRKANSVDRGGAFRARRGNDRERQATERQILM